MAQRRVCFTIHCTAQIVVQRAGNGLVVVEQHARISVMRACVQYSFKVHKQSRRGRRTMARLHDC